MDRQDALVRAGSAVEQQWKVCLELELQSPIPVAPTVELERAASGLRARESEFDAQLMNGCVNSLLLSLDDYCQHRQADVKVCKRLVELLCSLIASFSFPFPSPP